MAGTDITNLLEIIQRKIDAADSTSATQDLLYLLSAVRQGDGSSLELYDSTGAFPDLTDSAADTEMIGYKLDSDRLYFNVGVWKGKTLPPPPPPPIFQGTNFGYTSGGGSAPAYFTARNVIDKFPFSSDGSAADVGDLSVSRYSVSGQSSSTDGYTSGGSEPAFSNIIDKFPFSSDGNATDVGDLTVTTRELTGQSSTLSGYTSGGYGTPGGLLNTIEKFPFASDGNASDVGDLTVARQYGAGQSSTTSGYTTGGASSIGAWPTTQATTIDKFPFASDANATDVGDLSVAVVTSAGQSSSENGYNTSGRIATPGSISYNFNIDKFPFASDASSVDIGNATVGRYRVTGQSSTLAGYTTGGYSPVRNEIDKFSFTSDANATDVGDLTVARASPAGQQY